MSDARCAQPVPESYGEGDTLTSAQIANCILVMVAIGGELAKLLKAKATAVDRNTNLPCVLFTIGRHRITGCAEILNQLGNDAADFLQRLVALRA